MGTRGEGPQRQMHVAAERHVVAALAAARLAPRHEAPHLVAFGMTAALRIPRTVAHERHRTEEAQRPTRVRVAHTDASEVKTPVRFMAAITPSERAVVRDTLSSASSPREFRPVVLNDVQRTQLDAVRARPATIVSPDTAVSGTAARSRVAERGSLESPAALKALPTGQTVVRIDSGNAAKVLPAVNRVEPALPDMPRVASLRVLPAALQAQPTVAGNERSSSSATPHAELHPTRTDVPPQPPRTTDAAVSRVSNRPAIDAQPARQQSLPGAVPADRIAARQPSALPGLVIDVAALSHAGSPERELPDNGISVNHTPFVFGRDSAQMNFGNLSPADRVTLRRLGLLKEDDSEDVQLRRLLKGAEDKKRRRKPLVRALTFSSRSEGHYLTGAEIALGVVLISGAIAKAREQRSDKDALPTGGENLYKPSPDNSVRASWLVGAGDTLVGLAERFYNDGRVGYLIADINKDVTTESLMDGKRVVQIASRQMIYLPNKDDLEQFFHQVLDWAKPEDLITIVIEREFDRQLINMVMTRAMGIALTPVRPRPVVAVPRYMPPKFASAYAYGQDEQDNDHPRIPPELKGGATTFEGFLAYLKTKYRPRGDAGATARAQIPLRYKIEF